MTPRLYPMPGAELAPVSATSQPKRIGSAADAVRRIAGAARPPAEAISIPRRVNIIMFPYDEPRSWSDNSCNGNAHKMAANDYRW